LVWPFVGMSSLPASALDRVHGAVGRVHSPARSASAGNSGVGASRVPSVSSARPPHARAEAAARLSATVSSTDAGADEPKRSSAATRRSWPTPRAHQRRDRSHDHRRQHGVLRTAPATLANATRPPSPTGVRRAGVDGFLSCSSSSVTRDCGLASRRHRAQRTRGLRRDSHPFEAVGEGFRCGLRTAPRTEARAILRRAAQVALGREPRSQATAGSSVRSGCQGMSKSLPTVC
jgi:hypothetical protein